MHREIIISTSIDLVRIAPECIVYISSDGNYSNLVQTDGEMRMLSYQLGQIENIIARQITPDNNTFIRLGKSLIINRQYIYYIYIEATAYSLGCGYVLAHGNSIERGFETIERII